MEKRIMRHPILGESPERKFVKFTYDGKTLEGYEGEPVAAALRAAGVMTHRYIVKEEIIWVSVGGMPILDVGWGYECYRQAVKKGLGVTLNLWEKPYFC